MTVPTRQKEAGEEQRKAPRRGGYVTRRWNDDYGSFSSGLGEDCDSRGGVVWGRSAQPGGESQGRAGEGSE